MNTEEIIKKKRGRKPKQIEQEDPLTANIITNNILFQ